MTDTTDRIEKQIELNAPQPKVWKALTDVKQFNEWFGSNLTTPFTVGQVSQGPISCAGEEHMMEVVVTALDPESYFAYTWHPYALEKDIDYSKEEPTLVEFKLSAVAPDQTRLTIIESGFNKVPAHRRDEAFRMNSKGWGMQIESIVEYLEGTPVA